MDSPASTDTALVRHGVPLATAGSGAGALFPGPGWDQLLSGLADDLRGDDELPAVLEAVLPMWTPDL